MGFGEPLRLGAMILPRGLPGKGPDKSLQRGVRLAAEGGN